MVGDRTLLVPDEGWQASIEAAHHEPDDCLTGDNHQQKRRNLPSASRPVAVAIAIAKYNILGTSSNPVLSDGVY